MADELLLEDGDFLLFEDSDLMIMESTPVDGRVLIGLGDGPLIPNPAWTAFDNNSNCRCAGFDITVGRQSEFEATDIGRARVYFRDRNQTTNDPSLVGKQIQLQLWNPVSEEWVPRFRGHIEEVSADVAHSGVKADVVFNCVGIFDYLARCGMTLGGDFGNVPADGREHMIFYEDGPVGTQGINNGRIQNLLTDAGLDPALFVEFTGNVIVQESEYDPGNDVLSALRDAADAEFPGIANVYEDRFGRVVFHGRFARFDPDGESAEAGPMAWDFTRWEAATMEDVTSGVAQIREFSYSYPRDRLINSYIAWPRGIRERDKPGQQRTDPTSIGNYGFFGRSAPDLIIKEHKTNGNSGLEECGLFADFYVENYSEIRQNIDTVTFKAVWPNDSRAAALWDLMTRIDISDTVELNVDEAGIAGDIYYVEGLNIQCRPLNPQFDYVEVTPTLTPEAFYVNVFE